MLYPGDWTLRNRMPQPLWVRRAAGACGLPVANLAQSEVHTYAFAVAANILLSFFPFAIVMVSLCRYVFRWRAGSEAVYLAVGDFFPDAVYRKRHLRIHG